jgi:hypothetical protein
MRWGLPLFLLLATYAPAAARNSPSIAGAANTPSSEEKVISVYTRLGGRACSLVSVERTTGASVRRCRGVGKLKLLVARDDERASITIIDAHNKEFPLDFWDVVTPTMSDLHGRVEWRVAKRGKARIPIALIARLNVLDQSDLERPSRQTLVVITKITEGDICVVRVSPASRATAGQFRREADDSKNKTCLGTS